MENQIQYVHACEIAFFSFLKTGDIEMLTNSLKKVERHAKRAIGGGKDNSLWFKFFIGDTGATDIRNLEKGLNPTLSPKGNIDFYKECLKDAVSLNGSLQVYYS